MVLRVGVTAAAISSLTGLTLALAACGSGTSTGSGQPSATALVKDAKAAFSSAKSVRVAGTVTTGGQTVTLNVGMFRSGDMSGSIKAGPISGNVIVAGGSTYFYVSKDFFSYLRTTQHLPASVCSLMCGKYVKVPPGSITSKFSLNVLSGSLQKQVPLPPSSVPVKVTTYHGQAAYELSYHGDHVFIARNGTHYLLGVSNPAKAGTVSFSDWNKVPPVTAPPASKVFSTG
jgi:hypothetical protein